MSSENPLNPYFRAGACGVLGAPVAIKPRKEPTKKIPQIPHIRSPGCNNTIEFGRALYKLSMWEKIRGSRTVRYIIRYLLALYMYDHFILNGVSPNSLNGITRTVICIFLVGLYKGVGCQPTGSVPGMFYPCTMTQNIAADTYLVPSGANNPCMLSSEFYGRKRPEAELASTTRYQTPQYAFMSIIDVHIPYSY